MFATLVTFEQKRDERFTKIDRAVLDGLYRDFMKDIGRVGAAALREVVPFEISTQEHMINYIDAGEVDKHSWGYSIDVGILPIEGAPDPEYPKYVDQGTGIYNLRASGGNFRIARGSRKGSFASPASALITSSSGNVMVFEKEGEGTIFTRWVKGQRPQNFSDQVERKMEQYIKLRKQKLRIDIAAKT